MSQAGEKSASTWPRRLHLAPSLSAYPQSRQALSNLHLLQTKAQGHSAESHRRNGSREKVPPRLPAYDISYPRISTPPSSRFLGTNNGKLAPPNFLIADNKAHRFATQEYLILNS